MRIADVRTAVVEANFDWTYVRVYADDGTYGTGEAFMAPALTEVVRALRPILIGEDPRDVDRLWTKMRMCTSYDGGSGFSFHAITGIEAALLDLVGKSLGVPVYQLLGGRYREQVRIYADCHAGHGLESLGCVLERRQLPWMGVSESADIGTTFYDTGAERHVEAFEGKAYALRAREAADAGFTALKFDLDVPTPYRTDTHARRISNLEVDHLVSLAEAVRTEVGLDVEVAFDLHWRYDVEDALRLAWALEGVRPLWLEDPIPPENIDALADVTRRSRVPICSGENWYTRHGFRRACEERAVSIIAPDLQKAGGLLEGRRIADLAAAHYMAMAPHCIASPLGLTASAHLCAAVPNVVALEFHALDVPFFDELLVGGRPVISDGHMTVTDAPGFGVELDEDVARRYARPGEPFFEAP